MDTENFFYKFASKKKNYYFVLKYFILIGFLLIFSIGFTFVSFAATYYVDGNASNDAGDGSVGLPKKYITSGLAIMSGGDTLIIKDGIYKGQNNMIGDYSLPKEYPPSGLNSSNYTVIKAENVGGVIIDAEYTNFAFSNFNSSKINYLRIEGIHFRYGWSGVFNLMGDYNKVLKCGFEDGQPSSDDGEKPIAFIAGGSSYTLVEDCWVWGKGRYGFYTSSTSGGTNHLIMRRLVIRLDDTPDNRVCAGLRFYNSNTNVAQNVFVVDSEPVGCSYYEGAFAMGGGSSTGEPDHSYYGNAAINNNLWSGFFPDKSTNTQTLNNNIFWDNGTYGFSVVASSAGTFNVDHLTAGKNTNDGYRSSNSYGATENVKNIISYGNGGYGLKEIDSIDTANVYGNTNGNCNNCGSITNLMTTNPFVPDGGYSSPALKYLVRIENGSNLKGAASDGGDIGATILKKIGVSGTLYGDDNWNQTTSENLWPWPYEDVWLPKLRAYAATGSGGNRGFAATEQTLTNYIWGYFNYDGNADTPAVTVPPMNVQASPGNQKVFITWNSPAAIALTNITGFRVYDVTGVSNPVVPGTFNAAATVSGNSTFTATVTQNNAGSPLINENTYTFAVTAVDSVAGESSYSYLVSATPQPLEITNLSAGFKVNKSNYTAFTVSGIAQASVNVTVKIGGSDFTAGDQTTTADGSGAWSKAVDFTGVTEGSVTLTAHAGSVTSAGVTGTFDKTPPAKPTLK